MNLSGQDSSVSPKSLEIQKLKTLSEGQTTEDKRWNMCPVDELRQEDGGARSRV